MKQQHSHLVQQVLQNIRAAFPEIAKTKMATQLSIDEAMISLGDFEPDMQDSLAINNGLLQLQASDIACKSAWALYKDYSINQTVTV